MTHDGNTPLDELRRRAERIAESAPEQTDSMDPEELRQLIHDLHVHQIELEMQNEELVRTQEELERSRRRYVSLFNNAPVGYVVLDRAGMIRRANHTFAALVDTDVLDLQDTPFVSLIGDNHRREFLARYRAMWRHPSGKRADLRFRRGRTEFWARIESLPGPLEQHETTDTGDEIENGAGVPGEPEELFLTVSDISDQKAVEEALRSSEEHLATTLHSVGDAVITTDVAGSVTDLNPVAVDLIGYTREEAKGRPVEEVFRIVDSRHRSPVENPLLRAVRENQIVALQNHTVLLSKSGAEHQIADSAAPIRKQDGSTVGAVLVFRNVTEEYRLQEERRMQALLLGQIQDLVVATDAAGQITYVNEAEHRVLEYEPEEMLGRHVSMLSGSEGDAAEQAYIIEEVRRNGRWRGEVTNTTRSGKRLRLDTRVQLVKDEEGQAVGMVGISTDITEREAIPKRLSESERQKSLLLDSMQELFLYLETDFTVGWANRSATEYFGGADRLAGRKCYEVWHEQTEPCTRCPIRNAMAGSVGTEAVIDTPDGRFWNIRTYPIRNADGVVVAVAEFAQDITDIERTKREQERLEGQLLQAQKLESVGRLAGGIAHDFNNLLTGIAGNTELAIESLPSAHEAHEYLGEIDTAADRAARLTGQLLAFSRKQVMQPAVIDPNQLVTGLSSMISRLIGEDLEFSLACRARRSILVDPGQIEQVLVNLAVNARDAMPAGGAFTMGTIDAEVGAVCAQTLTDVEPGAYVVLSVHDTGIGMAPEVLEHIFEPFFTTKPVDRGTGLGLATTFGIVKQHGGHVEVSSTEGVGSSFFLFFPVAEGSPARRDHHGLTILLAVEDPLLASIAEAVLAAEGYRVVRDAELEEKSSRCDLGIAWPASSLRVDLDVPFLLADPRLPAAFLEQVRRAV